MQLSHTTQKKNQIIIELHYGSKNRFHQKYSNTKLNLNVLKILASLPA